MTFLSPYFKWVILFAAVTLNNGQDFQNKLFADHRFTCPPGQVVSEIVGDVQGMFSKDRRWIVTCKDAPGNAKTTNCQWNRNNYVGCVLSTMLYQCPGDKVITGMGSDYKDEPTISERQYMFYCCDVEGHVPHSCEYTTFLNKYQGDLNYKVPKGKVLRGAYSFYLKDGRDRRFKFEFCEMDSYKTTTSG
ncbi:hypothetical protein RRG08_000263 [Elysia crispata]|uniref:Dermatopontin n=1 Tax=Elysia crispata TaxID=231223 RepID=A0AAE1CUE2_9GAST|nr:hypothetical protein RRG08_000263 [Elysia crispata]